jgi:hypothetical protein
MSDPNYPDLSGSHHHYPPTTADWVTSFLAPEDEVPENPLEPPPSTGSTGLHIGALLLIGGGLLALVALVLQLDQRTAVLVTWYLWPVVLLVLRCGATAFAIGAAARVISILATRPTPGKVNQAVSLAFAGAVLEIIVVPTLILGVSAPDDRGIIAFWLTAASVACLLLGGSILHFVYRSKLSVQDLANQAEKDQRMSEFTRGGKLFGMPFGARSGRF